MNAMKTQQQEACQQYERAARLDQEDLDRLVMEHLPEVNYIARRIHDRLPSHVPLEDLVNAGIVGLLEAIQNFDPTRNVQVKTFAKLRIQGAILDTLREFDWCPRTVRRKAREMEEASRKITSELGREPTEMELANEMKVDVGALQELLTDLRGVNLGSLQALEGEDGREEAVLKFMPSSPDDDPFYLCLRSELRDCLAQAVAELPEREQRLLALYYQEELTMKEVGAVLEIGEGRVSQLHSAAMIRIRARMKDLLAERDGRDTIAPSVTAGGATWKKS